MKGHGEKCGRKAEAAIVALLACPTIPEAAKKAGVGETTLRRWMQKPEFDSQYRAAKRQAWDVAIHALQQAAGEAVETLRAVAADKEAPANARVSSAKAILELGQKGFEMQDLEDRITELEKRLQGGMWK